MKTGTELIAEERQRQIDIEGWTEQHDDKRHSDGTLVQAAVAYAMCTHDPRWAEKIWPWGKSWFKRKDEVRNLIRAGALIAAEIDRLQRKEGKE